MLKHIKVLVMKETKKIIKFKSKDLKKKLKNARKPPGERQINAISFILKNWRMRSSSGWSNTWKTTHKTELG